MNKPVENETANLLFINAVCDQFESDLKSGKSVSIEQVLNQHRDQAQSDQGLDALKRELLSLEYHYGANKDQVAADLETRFPTDAEFIQQLGKPAGIDDETQAPVTAADTEVDFPRARPAPKIGPYQLLKRVGEGGMGEVWLAERTEPYQKVAVKLIHQDKAGHSENLKEFLARFEVEREALAMMSHPNIAKILDGGTTEEDQPYFVMEYVQGVSLNSYCDSNQLGVEERLRVFIDICRAVHHAHQKGIIHRDLKPQNIIVTEIDGKAVPKVIDFGLAKAIQTDSRLTDKTIQTQVGQAMGTWQYMSPEQAGASEFGVDTRTDVFCEGQSAVRLR